MTGVLEGFATIAVIVSVGWLLAHLRVLDDSAQVNLSRLAFYAASPALLLTVMQRTPLDAVLSRNLLTSLASFTAIAVLYLLLARLRWPGESLGSRLIGSLSAGYVNAGNLGIPIALYVLGDVAWVAPTLLVQLLLITPVYMALFDSDARGERPTLLRSLRRMFSNPITIGAIAGLLIAVLDVDLPRVVADPIELLGNMAVPSMLVAFGISLRRGPRPAAGASAGHVWTIVALKILAMPAIALGIGLALGLRGEPLFAVVVTAALPTAQNIFTYAVRYRREVTLARDAIFISTFASVPVIIAIAGLFHAVTNV
ncbi:AEC family transporter [Intrasporangium calvum]|uniref:AEC family transporter n=1 Tax=Intrasporangium calvum TaxID=53358 RepID=A0ABT5GIX8_9MICO|nr:AEC family transporter [Intrasporangium calvum]MDC5698166.1 AEC family transporter [Intrasporangium calvum]